MKLISNQQGKEKTRYIFYGMQLVGVFPIDTMEQIEETKKHFIPEAIVYSQLPNKYAWVRVNARGNGESLYLSEFPNEMKAIACLLGLSLPHNFRPGSSY